MRAAKTLLLAVAVGPACSAPYDEAAVSVTNRDADSRDAGRESVSVGGAATVQVRPTGRREYSGNEPVTVEAKHPHVASIRQTILTDQWTILGERAGRASFLVYVDGVLVDRFEFEVVEPSFQGDGGS